MAAEGAAAGAPARLKPLLGELGDLKRFRSAGGEGSVARRGEEVESRRPRKR